MDQPQPLPIPTCTCGSVDFDELRTMLPVYGGNDYVSAATTKALWDENLPRLFASHLLAEASQKLTSQDRGKEYVKALFLGFK